MTGNLFGAPVSGGADSTRAARRHAKAQARHGMPLDCQDERIPSSTIPTSGSQRLDDSEVELESVARTKIGVMPAPSIRTLVE